MKFTGYELKRYQDSRQYKSLFDNKHVVFQEPESAAEVFSTLTGGEAINFVYALKDNTIFNLSELMRHLNYYKIYPLSLTYNGVSYTEEDRTKHLQKRSAKNRQLMVIYNNFIKQITKNKPKYRYIISEEDLPGTDEVELDNINKKLISLAQKNKLYELKICFYSCIFWYVTTEDRIEAPLTLSYFDFIQIAIQSKINKKEIKEMIIDAIEDGIDLFKKQKIFKIQRVKSTHERR